MRQLLEVAREERERGNDSAKDCDIRSDHPSNVVDQVMGEAIFDSVEALIHFAANDFELKVHSVKPSVDCIESTA